ncbi:MAG: two-component regulator propeller domain-containing protein, partial [Saprospiraceae bacterium]
MKISQLLVLALLIYGCNTKIQSDSVKTSTATAIKAKQVKPEVKHIDYHSGDVVSGGLEARDGKLWFGTSHHGVYRYDGISFTNFREQDGLPSNEVYAVLEDSDGLLWFGTSEGLCTYDGEKFTHLPIPHNGRDGAKTVLGLFRDKAENIWLGTWGNGVYR